MKYLALLALLLSGPGWGWLSHVRERNAALAQAQAAYRRGDAAGAAASYQQALAAGARSSSVSSAPTDPRLQLNLAHAQLLAGRPAAARATYGQLLSAGRLPAALGSVARQQLAVLAARQQQYAQALSLLRQALTLDPANAGARYDYEVLRDFLDRQPTTPSLPPPARATPPVAAQPPTPPSPANAAKPPASPQPRAGGRPGADQPGPTSNAERAGPPARPPLPRPDATGQSDLTRPNPAPGATAGGLRAGSGPARPLPTGAANGAQRGLAADAARPPAGRRRQPGQETAGDADQQLQTQRERLRQLNLTPTQARQLLDALRAQEQQYLQQRPRPAGRRARPGEPTW